MNVRRATRHIIEPLFTLLLLAGCQSERTYDVRGRISGFGDDARTVIIEHEAIPGLMSTMTMPFEVRDSTDLTEVEIGDAVEFTLVVAQRSAWIEHLGRLPDDAVAQHPAGRPDAQHLASTSIVDVGDPLPTAELITHVDTTLHLASLRGRPVFLTFIYTSCPIPDFCPLMSRQFAELQHMLQRSDHLQAHLVSISFDPKVDSPAVLRDYAAKYTSDLSNWTFATGDSANVADLTGRFGVFYRTDGDQVLHNLTTVYVDEQGIIREICRGNDWRPEELLAALQERAS